MLAAPEVAARTQVWEDADGQVAAYALVDNDGNLWFDRTPAAAACAPDDALVAWGVACAQRLAASTGRPVTLDTACRAEDHARIAGLQRHGFTAQAIRTLRYARRLTEPIPEPALPAGYTIRSAVGAVEVEALVALHRAAFGTEHLTVAERLAWMAASSYDPALDLVAVAPDGSLAAYCFCAIHPEENRLSGRADGVTDPLATHPAHQGRGLARALLAAGMTLLRARGVERAVLGTSSDNRAMQAVAQAVGYRIASERVWFTWRAPAADRADLMLRPTTSAGDWNCPTPAKPAPVVDFQPARAGLASGRNGGA
jgi:ribosomal protein S18 acetylase RimI-like enzyme